MSRRIGFLLALAVIACLGGALAVSGAVRAAPGPSAQRLGPLSISLSELERTTLTGQTFTLRSEIRNTGAEASPALIANLDFVATDHETYIDPEDWSSQRTLRVDAIPAGASATQTWTVKPVLKGEVAIYVVVVPEPAALASAGPLAASPALVLHVGEHRSLNAGGVLPVVLAVPLGLALAFVGLHVVRPTRHKV